MSQCPNCGANISCGCQIRTASNGTKVCANCISVYEQSLVITNVNKTSSSS